MRAEEENKTNLYRKKVSETCTEEAAWIGIREVLHQDLTHMSFSDISRNVRVIGVAGRTQACVSTSIHY